MAIIGTFSKKMGGYFYTIRIMTRNITVSFATNDKNGNAKVADFRVMAGKIELGQIRTMAGAGE